MGEVNDIAIVGALNDILKYNASLMATKINGVFHVTLTWLGKDPQGNTAMGVAKGADAKLYLALSEAYADMISCK